MGQLTARGSLSALVILALLVAACGGSQPAPSGGQPQGTQVKVGLILPCAINDHTWCQAGYEAAKRLEQEGSIQLKYTSDAPQDTAAVSQLMAQYAQGGTQLVIGHSAWQDAVSSVASRFPNTAFVYAGGGQTGANVATYEEPIYEPAYLAGILAAGITKTGVLGGLAGQDIPLCHAELEAFTLGAKKVRADVRQLNTYIGDWNDVAKAKQATQAQADQGADVFIACGDGPARGMISLLQERNLSGFGYVGDMNSLAPKNVVGSLVYNLYPFYKQMVEDVSTGHFKPGKSYKFGLREGGFELKLNADYAVAPIPASIKAQMDATRADIVQGKAQVPYIPK